jgi:hypothetical protein
MLHACFTPFASCFVYTSWRFYIFSRTNLLTRCHSASSLFSAVFVFQKSYIGNILGIGQNEDQNSYFSRTKDGDRTRAGGGPEGSHTLGWRPLACAALWCGGPGPPLTPPLRLYKAIRLKTLKQSSFFQKEFRSSAATTDEFRGTEVPIPAPCRDAEVPPEPYPSISITVTAFSINLTSISTPEAMDQEAS